MRPTLPLFDRRGPRTGLVSFALAVLLAPGFALPLAAQADSVLRDFEPTSEFLVLVAGKEVPKAEVFESAIAGAYLLITSNLGSPVLLSRRTGTAESVNLMKVNRRPDGHVDLLASATLTQLGRFQLDQQDVVFTAEGKEIRFRPKPPLIGPHSREDLVAHSPSYLKTAVDYVPDAKVVQTLKNQQKTATVRIFFGSWCPHCRHFLPHAIKLQDQLGSSKIRFEYFGLDRGPEGFKVPEAVKMEVKGVPTGIVFVDGKEVGRIVGNDWINLETNIAKMVLGSTAAPTSAAH
ncbi:MAG TPA: thioredoxin family protein [Thermoanaerobaculia bacterium]|nr:thioredoxin family protein [Thermoanaerobaculia bacterium]